MKIKVGWLEEPLNLKPFKFDHDRYSKSSSDTSVYFKHEDKKYCYSWASGGGMGLSSLYLIKEDGSTEIVYDAWRRDWKPEHVALHEAARQLSNILKHPNP